MFVNAGVSLGSVLRLLLFLTYINDLPQGLISVVKLFPDDTSLFLIVDYVKTSASALHNDLLKMQERTYQRKMSFYPDWAKQVLEVIFQ